MNWDDLKFVLAVAEAGSANGAARRLRVNHATVLRRIGQIEMAVGAPLFDRDAGGYRVTHQGQTVLAAAGRVRNEVQRLDRSIAGPLTQLDGQIRVTTTDSILVSVVGPALHTFQQAFPAIDIDLIMRNDVVSLARREADVAIRPTRSLPEGIHAQRVAALAFAIYASPEYLANDPDAPGSASRWLVVDPSQMPSPTEYWMRTHMPMARESVRAGSYVALGALAELGQGVAILPCCLGGSSSRLVRLGVPLQDIETGLWVMTPNELHAAAPIEAFCNHMTTALTAKADLLEGRQ